MVIGDENETMKDETRYQVGIIGGGLAGLTLAIQLRKAGVNVILFEKESYPFHKVCGEYISMESWDFLEQLGIPLSAMSLPKITELNVSAPNGLLLSHKLDLGGFGISRYTLDYQLYMLAKSLGVVIKENCKVLDVLHQSIQTNQGNFIASIVVGSWGKRSRMDAALLRDFQKEGKRQLNNYVGVKYHVKADLPDNLIELHNFRNGYCGISKIEEHKYCMCYLVKGEELKKAGGSIKQLEEKVLMQNPYLKKYFTHFPSLYDKPLTISQISFESKTTVEDGILMAGDAAGLITPLCGNGMSMAMHASKILATLLIQHVNNEIGKVELEQKYTQLWHQAFSKRLKTGRLIQSLFGNSVVTNLTIGLLKPFPFMVRKLVESTHGKPF